MPDSKLSSEQVLARSFDPDLDKLRVDAEVTATIGTVDVIIDAAGGDNVAISDGTDTLAINPDGSINVVTTVDTTGLATDANQTNGSQKTQIVDGGGDVVDVKLLSVVPLSTDKGMITQSIIHGLNSGGGGTYVDVKVNPAGKLLVTADLEQGGVAVGAANPVQVTLANTGANATAVKVDGSAVTQPISATSLPLPTGAATEATLNTLEGKIPSGLTVTGSRLQVELPAGGSGLTDAELRATPVEVDVVSMPVVTVTNAISSNAFNLNAAPYSQTSALTADYIINHIELNFSTTQSRDITVTLANGTVLWQDTGNTNLNIVLEDIEVACNGGENFTIAITQTAGACSIDVLATVKQGEAPLASAGSLIQGMNDAGNREDLAATPEGHLEVAIHGPRNPFGSIHVENLTPIFQTDAVYGLSNGQTTNGTTGTGSAAVSNSMFVCSTGTTIYSSAYIQSRKRLRYRAGQGMVGRFTALYTTGVANSYQVAGFGHAEDGVYFGYKGTDFGIIYNHHGIREVRTLTVTGAASGAGTVTVTLNGTAYNVAVSASATNIQRLVWELSQATYSGWRADPVGATVVFVSDSVGSKSGSYSISGLTTSGTFASTVVGQAVTEVFVPQTDWNGDTMDGGADVDNKSGATLDPTKLNVYQIGIQYLGAGSIVFQIEAAASGNNAEFVTVHTLRLPNTLTQTSFSNPSFPFTMSAYSAGSTTNLTVKCGSFAGFIEGQKKLHGNRLSYFNSSTGVGAANYTPLFTIGNNSYFNGRANQAVINILSCVAAIKHTSPVILYLFKNATLTGNPNFSYYSSGISCSIVDTAATQCSITTNDQLIWTGHLGDTGNIDFSFDKNLEELTLQPGEFLTLAAKSVTGSPSYVTGAINTREDQ